MLNQGFVITEIGSFHYDQHSNLCKDGKPCDSNGLMVFEVDGKRFNEANWNKDYLKFSDQFRRHLIMEDIQKSEKQLNMQSCSCSKCGTISYDEHFWL